MLSRRCRFARDRLLRAIQNEEPIGIYADRDVDGLMGLAILARSLRSLGGNVVWGSPVKGRGLERPILERFLSQNVRLLVCVDCGTGEHESLTWLAEQGVEVIVADHHRMNETLPPALAWIHPGALAEESDGMPAGCVMAFKLAQAIWLSFLGTEDPERLDYFLYSHLDLLALGILADRVPLTGENRIFTALGLQRLAHTRKPGLEALMRLFHLLPRSSAITVEEASWQIIPILNAAGRLGRPDLTAELLLTEDPGVARERMDQLLDLNRRRRDAQDKSLAHFELAVFEQCSIPNDAVLVARGTDQEPSVTGLAAQSLVQKYSRPVFLFVEQGEELVGSGRGLPGVDLFAWIQSAERWLIKFGGHEGAVGLTIRSDDFSAFRQHLLQGAAERLKNLAAASENDIRPARRGEIAALVEAQMSVAAIDTRWYETLKRLEPFGQGHAWPVFELTGIERIVPIRKPRSRKPCENVLLQTGSLEIEGELEEALVTALPDLLKDSSGRWSAIAYPAADRKSEGPFRFKWIIQSLRRNHG